MSCHAQLSEELLSTNNISEKELAIQRLEALVAPLTSADFFSSVWPTENYVCQQGGKRLNELVQQPEFKSIESIVNIPYTGLSRAHFNQHDIEPKTRLTPEQLVKAYKLFNATVYLQKLQTSVIQSWNRSLDLALNLSPGTVRMECFVSPKGKGLGWHYDDHETFIVQLKGKKLWSLADNSCTKAIGLSQDRLAEKKAWSKYDKSSVRPPSAFKSYEMNAGSVIYLPYGHWHSVENLEDSVHLVLNVSRSYLLTNTLP